MTVNRECLIAYIGRRNPELLAFPNLDDEVARISSQMTKLQVAAQTPLDQRVQAVMNADLIWCFSSTGTATTLCKPKDPYISSPDTYGRDRMRIQRSFEASKALALARYYRAFPHRSQDRLLPSQVKAVLDEYAPPIYYNGMNLENAGLAQFMNEGDPYGRIVTRLPRDKVIIDSRYENLITNTATQIEHAAFPSNSPQHVLVLASPEHAHRIMTMIGRNTNPEGHAYTAFPVLDQVTGTDEIQQMETCGTLYYGNNGKAQLNSMYSYV